MMEVEFPFSPPPVLPHVFKQLEEYLKPDQLPLHSYERAQRFWARQPSPSSLYFSELSEAPTTLQVIRDQNTGEILDYCEVENVNLLKVKSQVSDNVLKSGFNDLDVKKPGEYQLDISFDKDLLTIVPGFYGGIEFERDGFTPINSLSNKSNLIEKEKNVVQEENSSEAQIVNLMNLLQQEENANELWDLGSKEEHEHQGDKSPLSELTVNEFDEESVLPKESSIPVLKISEHVEKTVYGKQEWAEELDITKPVEDFHTKIPEMAFTWPFELDTFQKQAILKLEDHCNVFVSAHTSAGKTVVAEYAIALALRQKARAIYTSPIKALSNQKYRDFKKSFEEDRKIGKVGLITGDFQLNPDAGCLIMTTEILRSMLYQTKASSSIIKELEYVIFDEVHYINDKDRGHVWEEVLILLPKPVRIVMLSATVPNSLEFANWVGSIRKSPVYVISTLYRPVPLEHYLYTGTHRGNRKDCFLISKGEKSLIMEGYRKAEESKKEAQMKKKKSEGRGSPRDSGRGASRGGHSNWNQKFIPRMNPKEQQQQIACLIEYLQEENQLPVVIFTLSRKRCDNNAEALEKLDLTTELEKHRIRTFFKKCIHRLKEEDRRLPQVKTMEKLLLKGIGIHHSGILPILKEIVELLFQEGKLKLLFATETFAMGVNMPTRTVVFDSIDKFTGSDIRELLPSEYIQMAGRAGRRGKDKTGMVIILCKEKVPPDTSLKKMMKFDKSTKLQSQFHTTYAMILKTLRLRNCDITLEDMMARSFKEYGYLSNKPKFLKELEEVQKELDDLEKYEIKKPGKDVLEKFYATAFEFIQHDKKFKNVIMLTAKVTKLMRLGQIVVIRKAEHVNKYGMVLSVQYSKSNQVKYQVLVLCNQDERKSDGKPDLYYEMLSLKQGIFIWDCKGGHTILELKPENIVYITPLHIPIEPELIINDWKKRQTPRFSEDPVGQQCRYAVDKLASLLEPPKQCLNLMELWDKPDATRDIICHLKELHTTLNHIDFSIVPNCDQLFEEVFDYMDLKRQKEEKIKELSHKISIKSLSSYADLQRRLSVLRKLEYIDDNNTVAFKGTVASSMGSNELMITELVFNNVLTNYPPPVIAAVLSSLVFQSKADWKKVEHLEEGRQAIEEVYNRVVRTELHYHLNELQKPGMEGGDSSDGSGLNYGLMEVVYNWAQNKPFSEIMELTDVQEGLIVRCIQQLCEVLQYVKDAAHKVGDPVLETKMEEVTNAIKRDIVFPTSLYTEKD